MLRFGASVVGDEEPFDACTQTRQFSEQSGRAPVSLYFGLVEELPPSTEVAEHQQIINVLDFINRLLGTREREEFQRYARSLLRPTFETLGWEPKEGELPTVGNLRASLINALGDLNDPEIIAG